MIKKYFTTPSFTPPTIEAPETTRLAAIHYIILGILIIVSCYYGISSYPLLDFKEGIFAEVAREMATQSYIIPHLNFVPYLVKPPLIYWLLTLSYHMFGTNEFAARVVPSTAMALTALMFFYFGKKTNDLRTGWLTAIILLSSIGFVIIGRIVSIDMLLTCWVSASLLCFYLWYHKNDSAYLIGYYLFLALAVLTDGGLPLLVVVPIVVVFAYLTKKDNKQLFQLFNRTGIILFLIIALPWFILATLMQSGFVWDYFINEQLLRLFNRRIPSDFHTGSVFYYIPRVIAYLLPWSLLLPVLFRLPSRMATSVEPLKLFLWTWFIVSFFIFSFAQAKGNTFMILGAPPLAYLLASKIDEYLTSKKSLPLQIVFVLFAFIEIVSLAIFIILKRSTTPGQLLPYGSMNMSLPFTLILLAVSIVYTAGAIYVLYKKRDKVFLPFLFLAAFIIPITFYLVAGAGRTQDFLSESAIGRYLSTTYEQMPVYIYQNYDRITTLSFYAQQRFYLIDSKSSTLYFGATRSDSAGWFLTMDDFLKKAKAESCYAVVTLQNYTQFQNVTKSLGFCTIQKNGDVLLLSNSSEDCKLSESEDKDKAIWDEIAKRTQSKNKVLVVPLPFGETPFSD